MLLPIESVVRNELWQTILRLRIFERQRAEESRRVLEFCWKHLICHLTLSSRILLLANFLKMQVRVRSMKMTCICNHLHISHRKHDARRRWYRFLTTIATATATTRTPSDPTNIQLSRKISWINMFHLEIEAKMKNTKQKQKKKNIRNQSKERKRKKAVAKNVKKGDNSHNN